MSENKENTPKIRFPGFTDAWEQRRLGELMEISSASRVHKEEWTETGVPFFRSSDVVSAFKGLENDRAFISYELFEELSNKSGKVQENDLLVTGGGSIGIPYKVRNNEPLYFKDADLIWLKNSSLINSDFLYTFLITPVFRRYVGSITHIGTISHYTIEQAKATPIMMPEIEEQKHISQFFAQLDRLITLHQRKLNNVKNLKAGLLQKMFPKNGEDFPEVRFPGFTDAWELCELGKVVDVRSGKDYKHLSEGTIPVYGTGGYMLSVNEALSYDEDAIGIGRKGTIDKPYILKAPFWTVDTLFYAVPRANNDLNFVFNIFQRIDWKKKDESTGVPSLSKAAINDIQILITKDEEQKTIGTFFTHLDHLITLHQRKLEHLQEQKKALLQQMFI
ncbi:restriction endonuclease subunit S [Paenibacillus peoriae]|uniref:restriction endonuclease subunit S n=1 Tax=Paenibacillus peoriae TaxID=59893 RepID=UPI0032B0147A